MNTFIYNNQEYTEVQKVRGGVVLKNLNGEIFLKNEKEENLFIKCSQCGQLKKIRSIRFYNSSHFDKKYECFSCRSKGEKNPFYGKKHTKELKQKRSQERRGVWGVGEKNGMFGKTNYEIWLEKYGKEEADRRMANQRIKMSEKFSGENNPFYGKTHTEKTKEKISENLKISYSNLSKEEKEKRRMSEIEGFRKYKEENYEKFISDKKKANKASFEKQFNLNKKENKIEQKVKNYLEERFPTKFKFSVILDKYQFDFGNKDKKILIEVHGDYWHCNPRIYDKPKNKTQENKISRDKEKKEFAEKHGFKLFIIWEDEIKNNNFSSLDNLKEIM